MTDPKSTGCSLGQWFVAIQHQDSECEEKLKRLSGLGHKYLRCSNHGILYKFNTILSEIGVLFGSYIFIRNLTKKKKMR